MPPASRRTLSILVMILGPACNTVPGSVGMFGTGDPSGGGDGLTSTTEATTMASTATVSTTTTAATVSTGVDDTSTDDGTVFDLPQPDTDVDCGGKKGPIEFANIWIANSSQGTVSRIDTFTRTEIARYATGPGGQTNPSRTSVNLDGDVAVVNRQGGITMIQGRVEECGDDDGNGQIDTSQGAADIRPWGQDECVAWNTELPTRSRPVAWTAGELVGCNQHANEKIWTSAPEGDDVRVYLLDGETGVVEDEVLIPDVSPSYFEPVYHGIYGAAVDGNDDMWGCIKPTGDLVHVSFSDLSWERIEVPALGAPLQGGNTFDSYGMTVSSDGTVWVGGQGVIQRYDPIVESWASVVGVSPNHWTRGMMVDADGDLWVAVIDLGGGIAGSTSVLMQVDTAALTVADIIDTFPGVGLHDATGVSIDVDGYVWIVGQFSDGVYVYDPTGAGATDFVGGLVSPYTYSDMTGWALKQVAEPAG